MLFSSLIAVLCSETVYIYSVHERHLCNAERDVDEEKKKSIYS